MIQIRHEFKLHPHLNEVIALGLSGDVKFRRLAGGLHWPTIDQPGFALILTEDQQKNDITQLHHLRILEEQEDQRIDGLLDWCEMRGINMPSEIPLNWYADNTNRPNMEFVWHLNKSMRQQGRTDALRITPPPYIDHQESERDGFYLQNIRKYLTVEALHFPPDSRLVGELYSIEDKLTGPVLALSYVLSAMATWPNVGRMQG